MNKIKKHMDTIFLIVLIIIFLLAAWFYFCAFTPGRVQHITGEAIMLHDQKFESCNVIKFK